MGAFGIMQKTFDSLFCVFFFSFQYKNKSDEQIALTAYLSGFADKYKIKVSLLLF